MLYNSRKKALKEGGSTTLAETAAGGKDLITSMKPPAEKPGHRVIQCQKRQSGGD
ncbi:hypothetical protein B0H14DRAFT_3511732 [Mycena olivaceomarginata]|nr:hypothetical protein B0H14DRAFT_3511732 [Mycena olivaceomarginata]